jgi:hypothetical protein
MVLPNFCREIQLFRLYCTKNFFFFKLGQKYKVLMFTFELICMLLEGYLKIFTLSSFYEVLKNIEIFGFLAQAQHA